MAKFAVILTLIIASMAVAEPGDRRDYAIMDFSGGLNVATDSIDLSPNEAITLDNFVLDKWGSLHKRYGAINWNDSLISPGHIKDIHYLEDKNGSKRLFIASTVSTDPDTGCYVYEQGTWTDTNSVWEGRQVKYRRGKIDTTTNSSQKYIYSDTTNWLIAIAPGDRIRLQGGGNYYVIDSVLADTCLHVSANITVVGDTFAGYRIYKYVNGEPHLSSWNGNLYVADSKGFPWFYDGDNVQLLGVVDYGTVTHTAAVETTTTPYESGRIRINTDINLIRGIVIGGVPNFNAFFENGDTVGAAGNLFHLIITVGNGNAFTFTATITRHTAITIELDRRITPGGFSPRYPTALPRNFTAPETTSFRTYWNIVAARGSYSEAGWFRDTTKAWEPGRELIGFYLLNGNKPEKYDMVPATHTEDRIFFDTAKVSFTVGNKYYVVWQIPSVCSKIKRWSYTPPGSPRVVNDSVFINKTCFKQILFHANRLYAIGYEVNAFGSYQVPYDNLLIGDTVNTNRIWFSDLGRPNYILPEWNFDLSGASSNYSIYNSDDARALFTLRGTKFAITGNATYRIEGEPDPEGEPTGYGLFINEIDRGTGIPGWKSMVIDRRQGAYLMNQQGLWWFDGNTIRKVSYKIDPLVERYRGSKMVAGQWKDNLLFSYPDSNRTLILHQPTSGFTLWDFGMECINNQSVATDSNYFLFAGFTDSAYVMKYPRNTTSFYDTWSPGNNVVFPITYKTGWMSLGDWEWVRVIEKYQLAITKGTGAMTFNTYIDFDDSLYYSYAIGYAATQAFLRLRPGNSGSIRCNVLQLQVASSTTADFTLSGIKIKAYDSGDQ